MTTGLVNYYWVSVVPGDEFEPSSADPTDTRATGLKAQLDDMVLLMNGKPPRHDPRGASCANLDRGHFVRPAR